MSRTLALLLISAACSGSSGAAHVPLPQVPAPETRATLVGPRCRGSQRCVCRDVDQPATAGDKAKAPFKRYEIRVGPLQNDLWVTIDDMSLYKSKERATECFYVDLLPGKHPVRIHGKAQHGLGVQVHISELSAGGPWWYDTFTYNCGGSSWCALEDVKEEQTRIDAVPRQLHDPCGSAKVKGLSWQTGRMPDALHPAEIVVDFTLQVYKFATEHEPGSKQCKGN